MFRVFSQDVIPGEIVAICAEKEEIIQINTTWKRYEDTSDFNLGNGLTMHVREFSPMKESLRTWVSLLALNGVWGLLRPRALIHSLNEKSEDTMYAYKTKNAF